MKAVLPQSRLALKLSWAIAAILVLLPFQALLTTWLGSNFGHLDAWRIWKDVLVALLVPLAVWLAWHSPKIRHWFIRSPILNLFRLYVLLHVILGSWAYSTHRVNAVALIYSLIINLRFIFFFAVCYIVAANYDFLKKYWQTILLAPAAIVIAFGLIQRLILPQDFLRHFGYGPKTIPAYQTVDANLDYRRIQSTLRGANPLGAYLLLTITVAATSLRKNRNLLALYLLGAAAALFYSYSRSAWVGTVLSLAVLGGLTIKMAYRLRWLVGVALVAMIVIAGSIYTLRSNPAAENTLFHSSSASTSARSTNAERAAAIKAGAREVLRQPLGRGPGTAGPASFRNTGQPARIAENYYLQIGQEVGILGMILFITINILVGLELWRRRQEPLAAVLLASLIGLTFVNLVSHAWTDDTLSYLWWGLAGIALAPALISKHKPPEL